MTTPSTPKFDLSAAKSRSAKSSSKKLDLAAGAAGNTLDGIVEAIHDRDGISNRMKIEVFDVVTELTTESFIAAITGASNQDNPLKSAPAPAPVAAPRSTKSSGEDDTTLQGKLDDAEADNDELKDEIRELVAMLRHAGVKVQRTDGKLDANFKTTAKAEIDKKLAEAKEAGKTEAEQKAQAAVPADAAALQQRVVKAKEKVEEVKASLTSSKSAFGGNSVKLPKAFYESAVAGTDEALEILEGTK